MRRADLEHLILLGSLSVLTTCGGSEAAPSPGFVPPNPGGPLPDGSGITVLAISSLDFGDETVEAWKAIGLDIDGKETTATSTDVCSYAPGAFPPLLADGDNGIDNSFGENLVPLLYDLLTTTLSQDANAALRAGDATTLFAINRLGSQANYAPLDAVGYRAAPSEAPRWDGSDKRDVDVASLISGDISQPILTLSGGYMNGRVWVSGPASGDALFDIHLAREGHFPDPFPIHHVRVLLKIDPTNRVATSGILAGIVSPDDAIRWMRQMAGWDSNIHCSQSALDGFEEQIRQAADIFIDGSNHAGAPCDGISFGIGFDAMLVTLGDAVSVPPTAPPDDCPDAGDE
ncbi:MAG: hypothetical protein ACRELY_07920 [Polyangiaceae bacterium]